MLAVLAAAASTTPRPRAPGARDSRSRLLYSLHPRFFLEQQVPPQEPRASGSTTASPPDLRPAPWQTHLGVRTAVANALEAGEPAAGGRSTGAAEKAPRVGSRDRVPSSLPGDAQSITRSAHRGSRSLSWESGRRTGTRNPTDFPPGQPSRSLDAHAASSDSSWFSLPSHPTPALVRVRTLQIPGRTFRRKQVDQARPHPVLSESSPSQTGDSGSPKQSRHVRLQAG